MKLKQLYNIYIFVLAVEKKGLLETIYIHPTKLGCPLYLPCIHPEVEQPASSRLVDLPYVRHVIQNLYVNEAHMVFQRLWPT